MYRYGPPESFATPTTTGSECGAAPVNKASRALFDGARISRLSENVGCPASKQHADRPEHPEEDARARWLGDLTKEDLQELWRHTSIFPLITKADSAETPSGCELEVVQQQQVAYLAQLLKDKACSRQANCHPSHSQSAAHIAQPAQRGSYFAGNSKSDSLESKHGAGQNSSKIASAVHASSSDPSVKAQPGRSGQHELQPRLQSRHALLPIHSNASYPTGSDWHQLAAEQHHYGRSASADGHAHANGQHPQTDWRQTHRQMGSAHPTQLNQHHSRPYAGVTNRQPYQAHQLPSGFDAPAQAAYAGNPQHLQNSYFNPGSHQMFTGNRQGPEQARAVLQAMAAQQCQEQGWPAQRSPQLNSLACHSPNEPQQHSPQLIMPGQGRATLHGPFRQGRAASQGPLQSGTLRHSSQLGPAAGPAPHANLHPPRHEATVDPPKHDAEHSYSERFPSASATSSAVVSQGGVESAQQPRTSYRLGLKRKQAALLASSTEGPPSGGPASKKVSATGLQGRQNSGDLPATSHDSQAATSAGSMGRPASHSTADDAGGVGAHHGTPTQSMDCRHPTSSISASETHSHEKAPVSEAGLAQALQEVDLLTDPSDALGLSPERLQIQDDLPGLQDYLGCLQDDLPADPVQGLPVPSWSELLKEAAGQLTPQGFPRSAPGVVQRPTFAWTDSPAAQHQRYDMGMNMLESGMQTSQHPMPSASAQLNPSTASQHDALMRFINSGGSFAQQHRHSQISSQDPAAASRVCLDINAQARGHSNGQDAGLKVTQQAGTASHQSQNPVAANAAAAAKPPKPGTATSDRQGRPTQPGLAQSSQHVSVMGQGRGQKASVGQGRPQVPSKKQPTGTLGTVLPFAMLKGSGLDSDLNGLNSRIQATVLQPPGAKEGSEAGPATASMHRSSADTDQAMPHSLSDAEPKGASHFPSSVAHHDDRKGCNAAAQTAVNPFNTSASKFLPGRSHTRSGKACGAASVQLLKLSGTTKVGLPV